MRLVIITDDGEIHEVVSDLEGFNLAKPLAKEALIDEIKTTLVYIQDQRPGKEES